MENDNALKFVLVFTHLNSNASKKNMQFISSTHNAPVALDDESIKSTRFLSGGVLVAFIRRFCGLKGLPNFFTQQIFLLFEYLMRQGSALVYIGDVLFVLNSKPHMLQLVKQLHDSVNNETLKIAQENFFSCFLLWIISVIMKLVLIHLNKVSPN